jgi:Ras-related protein Rab-6A
MEVLPKEKLLKTLMRNFIETIDGTEAIMIYTSEGFLINKYTRAEMLNDGLESGEAEEIYGAFASLVEPSIKKITSEYKIGELGLMTFEAPDHHLIFLEAGPGTLVLVISDYNIVINTILPYCYLLVEKIAQILEGSFDLQYNTLTVPKLEIGADFDGDLMSKSLKEAGEFHIERSKKEKVFKLIILGDQEVGKTTLVTRFIKKKYSADYRPTLGISITTNKYNIQGFKDSMIRFLIYDLAGQDFFKRVRHIYYAEAQAAFCVYDVTRKDTFEGALKWYADAKGELGDIPFVLIGNKIDLEDQRQVSTDEGRDKAQELKCSFIETSAKENINVQDTFKILGIGLFFKEIPDYKEPVFLL